MGVKVSTRKLKAIIQASAGVLAGFAALSSVGCTKLGAGPNAGADNGVAPRSIPVQASKPTLGQEAAAIADNRVQVIFPVGIATLTPEANQKLDLAARLFRDANPVAMFTAGYTDKSGDEYGNVLLSARRAEAVKRGLVARGIPANRLLIQALGESDPANATDPLAPENRRVIITWRLL